MRVDGGQAFVDEEDHTPGAGLRERTRDESGPFGSRALCSGELARHTDDDPDRTHLVEDGA